MAAISTNTILDTIEWAKKLNFSRQSAIGNFLEPAKTSANIVLQTILGPPFEWPWNNEIVTFVTNPNRTAATITNTSLTSDVATYTTSAAHNFNAGQFVTVLGTTNGSGVFNVVYSKITAVPSSTTFTIDLESGNVTGASDTGSASVNPQDYAVNVPDFWHIEQVSIQDPTSLQWKQISVKNSLALDANIARPQFLSPNTQDPNTGDVVFRVMPAPDKAYPVSMQIQKAPVQITSINQTWAPLPDFMSYIYSWGFLALMYMFADDPRYATANQKFLGLLLSSAQGLTEQEKNIFLNNWNNATAYQLQQASQGIQARGV